MQNITSAYIVASNSVGQKYIILYFKSSDELL